MANRASPTYDDISRRTVPDLDSSMRPTKDQEREAFEGYRAMDEDESALHARVMDALRDSGINWQSITIEVDHDRVSVRGTVDDDRDLSRVPELIRAVDGVGSVDDRLVVLPGGAAD
jgi:osmotically-inducible protein OsmY